MIPIVTTAAAAQGGSPPAGSLARAAKPRSRRVAVQVATPNMTASMRTTKPGAANTPRSARATTVSCTTARPAPTRTARRWGNPPRRQHPHGDPDSTTRPMASRIRGHHGSGACGTSP